MSPEVQISNKKKILYCILNWGLGHATRSIPIINHLKSENYELIIASSGRSKKLLETEYPDTEIINLPDYNISYSQNAFWLPFKMLSQTPSLLINIRKEHQWIKEFCKQEAIDLIISDNKFGCYHKEIPSIFITHQIRIKSPLKWMEPLIFSLNHRFIKKYSECWIPDYNNEKSLSGQLSKDTIAIDKVFIGPISRFSYENVEKKYKYCAIISGPEPQRTILEKAIIDVLKELQEKSIIICGKPESKKEENINNLTIKNIAFGKDLENIINASEIIISRAGYSSIMDYAALRANAIIIPTPGQTEQEYLAHYLNKHPSFISMNKVDAEEIKKATFKKAASDIIETNYELISARIKALISR